jgi:predicted transposase/invertase (TIGR01784 family)
MSKRKNIPTNSDFTFRKIFGDPTDLTPLRGLLTAVLDMDAGELTDLKILDPHFKKENPYEKYATLDVKAKTSSGKRLNVEVQVQPRPAITSRIVYYISRMLTEQAREGKDYSNLKKVVTVHTVIANRRSRCGNPI